MASQTQEAKLVQLQGVEFLVDGFLFQRDTVKHYVLTHFHGDHTIGLNRRFASGTIYCTDVTAALIIKLIGVDPARVVGLALEQTIKVEGVELTLLDAGHCPGSAMAAFDGVLHTGDCRADEATVAAVQRWLNGRSVETLYLDTTYCSPRWRFIPQPVACEWLGHLTQRELQREPKTLFVVGCYQIGKERAAQAVAEACRSPVYVESRRWKVIQLAGWGDAQLSDGRPLWSIDKEGCSVWMCALGGLAHDVLKHFLDSTKGHFESVVAFSPTGWSWSKAMAEKGLEGCRCWPENDGKTRVYSVPYSEHSSYEQLQSLVRSLKPKRLVPTVNSESRESRERMMAPFLDVLDLKADRNRMDHYLQGLTQEPSEVVDVLSLSRPVEPWSLRAAKVELSLELEADELQALTVETVAAGAAPAVPTATTPCDDLRHVDVEQQKRLLKFFESSAKANTSKPGLKRPKKQKGKGKGQQKEQAPVLRHLGVKPEDPKPKPKAKRKKNEKGEKGEKSAKRKAKTKGEGISDPKLPGEKRPGRFIPKPSARVQERIDRAFAHRLYFLAREALEDGEKLDVLGSTGNVYHVELRDTGNSCSCLDFAKGGGVCKHLLFVMLRVLKLPSEDHRVVQTGLTASELRPLLETLRATDFRAVQADATVMRGYEAQASSQRRALPADCPICFEEIRDDVGVDFCRVCGHNVHADCQKRWAAAGKCDTCPMCRSPWKCAEKEAVMNLAAYSSEHRDVNLVTLYPETHRWIRRE